MTCRKDDSHPLDQLYKACGRYPGGIEALAGRLGISKGALYSKLRQQVATHRIGYCDELSQILHILEDAGVESWHETLAALVQRHGFLLVSMPAAGASDATDFTRSICKAVKEQAQAIDTLATALSDGAISDAEFLSIEREIHAAMTSLASLRERSRALYQRSRLGFGVAAV